MFDDDHNSNGLRQRIIVIIEGITLCFPDWLLGFVLKLPYLLLNIICLNGVFFFSHCVPVEMVGTLKDLIDILVNAKHMWRRRSFAHAEERSQTLNTRQLGENTIYWTIP